MSQGQSWFPGSSILSSTTGIFINVLRGSDQIFSVSPFASSFPAQITTLLWMFVQYAIFQRPFRHLPPLLTFSFVLFPAFFLAPVLLYWAVNRVRFFTLWHLMIRREFLKSTSCETPTPAQLCRFPNRAPTARTVIPPALPAPAFFLERPSHLLEPHRFSSPCRRFRRVRTSHRLAEIGRKSFFTNRPPSSWPFFYSSSAAKVFFSPSLSASLVAAGRTPSDAFGFHPRRTYSLLVESSVFFPHSELVSNEGFPPCLHTRLSFYYPFFTTLLGTILSNTLPGAGRDS